MSKIINMDRTEYLPEEVENIPEMQNSDPLNMKFLEQLIVAQKTVCYVDINKIHDWFNQYRICDINLNNNYVAKPKDIKISADNYSMSIEIDYDIFDGKEDNKYISKARTYHHYNSNSVSGSKGKPYLANAVIVFDGIDNVSHSASKYNPTKNIVLDDADLLNNLCKRYFA